MTRELAELLGAQHGVITRAQAMRAGLTERAIRTELSTGRWERALPGVYRLGGHRVDWMQRLWVAHLRAGPDSRISHESAGRLRELPQVPAGRIVLTIPHRMRRSLPGVTVHRCDDLAEHHVEWFEGLPVTTLARTLVDLASTLHIARTRLAVEHCVVERRVTLAAVGATLDEVRRSGKPGVAIMTRVLDELGPGDGIPNGELERLFDAVRVAAGLPAPIHEHPLPGVGPRTGFVDRCWPDARLIVEIDGRTWHSRRHQMLADNDRVLQAQAAGFDTLRLLWEHLAHDPSRTAGLLGEIHGRRCADLHRLRP